MRDFEEVTNELKEGATLIINSHKEGQIEHCNGYVYSDEGKKEEIKILNVFMRYLYIINEVRDDKFFKLSQDKETGKYLSGIYSNDKVIGDESSEESYMFDSLENLNLKLRKTKKLGGVYGK